MSGTMRGIVKAAAGPGLEFRTDLPIPEISDDEVLMKIRCASICGTDLGIYDWGDWARRRIKSFPRIVGHETTGEIVAVVSASPARRISGTGPARTASPGGAMSVRT